MREGVELTAWLTDRYHVFCNIVQYPLPSVANRSGRQEHVRFWSTRHDLKTDVCDREERS